MSRQYYWHGYRAAKAGDTLRPDASDEWKAGWRDAQGPPECPSCALLREARTALQTLQTAREEGDDPEAYKDACRLVRAICDGNGGAGVPFLDDAVRAALAAAETRGREEGARERDRFQDVLDDAKDTLRKVLAVSANREAFVMSGPRAFMRAEQMIKTLLEAIEAADRAGEGRVP
jgi:hypothetical protein